MKKGNKKPTSRVVSKSGKSAKKFKNKGKAGGFAFVATFLLVLCAIIGSLVLLFIVRTGCGLKTCASEFLQIFTPDTAEKKAVKMIYPADPLPPYINLTSRLNKPNPSSHLMIKDGVQTSYTGAKWSMVQPRKGWHITKIDSIIASANNAGKMFDKKGREYLFTLVGITQIDLEAPFGIAGQHALQKCADAGRYADMRVYHKKTLSAGESNTVYLIANGFDCGYELVKNGLADSIDDKSHSYHTIYLIANKAAKQSKIGKYSKM